MSYMLSIFPPSTTNRFFNPWWTLNKIGRPSSTSFWGRTALVSYNESTYFVPLRQGKNLCASLIMNGKLDLRLNDGLTPLSFQYKCGVYVTWLKLCKCLSGNGIVEKNGPSITVMPNFFIGSGTLIRTISVISFFNASNGSLDFLSKELVWEYTQQKTYFAVRDFPVSSSTVSCPCFPLLIFLTSDSRLKLIPVLSTSCLKEVLSFAALNAYSVTSKTSSTSALLNSFFIVSRGGFIGAPIF